MNEAYIDPTGEIACFCDSTGHYLPLLCVSNLSNGYEKILKHYNISHQDFNELIKKSPPGNKGRILVPWFTGERTPDFPCAAPVTFGFQPEDFNREVLCRAVLEGHVQNLYYGFKRLGIRSTEIRLTGGLSQSEAWLQCIADVFESDVVPVVGEGAALGAALHACWVWDREDGYSVGLEEIIEPFLKLYESRRKHPNEKNRDAYRSQHELYNVLVSGLLGSDLQALLL